ncbi:hypothetical protein M1B72_13100 [Geomonas paludis]|uniref:Glycosyl transferase family 11 n=1 Tax=Geomonas paludis TaxID=2740185 RepID=A0A6V8MXX0_9BACT|nr:hypothetical protein [Geomonas paludis]UPU34388.1 hypothetical protein M1B72_13100 [Geomonas paludis]GFO64373.1 hypothetical protein GMPD_22920 [Geomonas paludis]
MIVLAHKYGQLGNRLAYLRVYLSFALEHGVTVLDLSFDEYRQYFDCSGAQVVRLPAPCSALLRRGLQLMVRLGLLRRGTPFLPALDADAAGEVRLVDADIARRCRQGNVLIHDGWPVIDWNIVLKHDQRIRELFRPAAAIAAKVSSFIAAARSGGHYLVGVHIRQGDYRQWQDGKHYFTSEQYAAVMAQVAKAHRDMPVRFIVAASEPQRWELFAGLDYLPAPGSAVEDMYVLAQCDEIYGPQSSFSAWASFYGNVPVHGIEKLAAAAGA